MEVEWGLMKESSPEDVLYRTIGAAYRSAKEVAVISYPKSSLRRSIDVVISMDDDKALLVKAVDDVERLPKSEIDELRSVSAAVEVGAVIVAERQREDELLDEMVYERYGVKIVTPASLEMALRRDGPYLRRVGDVIKVVIDGETMRRKRLEMGLSLGDVARYVGTSRKAIYDYERGVMEPSIEKAERLVELFGEEILKPISFFEVGEIESAKPDTRLEAELVAILSSMGYKAAHAKRTAFDLVGSKGGKKLSLIVKHERESEKTLVSRFSQALKVSRIVGSKVAVVTERKEEVKRLERENINVFAKKELIEFLWSG